VIAIYTLFADIDPSSKEDIYGQFTFRNAIMEKWECYRCSYVTQSESPPDECPSCHHSATFWIGHVEESQLTVKDFVRSGLLKLEASNTVLDAAKLMKENDAGSVLVTVNGETTGL
jgi:hypothetical protein